MSLSPHIGIDLGGTNIRAAILENHGLQEIISKKINALASAENMLQQVFEVVDPLFNENIVSIGIGVPGLVDEKEKMVYDVVNIPAWNKIALEQLLTDHYRVPVFVNNDANCFALGEFHFGRGRGYESMVGLTIGTGLGCGIIIDGKLYNGRNGGAGEFGMMPYLEHNFEYYASGQFFSKAHGISGEIVFEQANAGNKDALNLYREFGRHLGKALTSILFALDIELVVIGGSLANAWHFYGESAWEELRKFPYQRAAGHLRIELSGLENAAIYGAASLHQNRI
jgi:glucokinase